MSWSGSPTCCLKRESSRAWMWGSRRRRTRPRWEADLGELEIISPKPLWAWTPWPSRTAGQPAQRSIPCQPAIFPWWNSLSRPGQALDLLRRRPDLIAGAAQLEGSRFAVTGRTPVDLFRPLAVQAAVGRSAHGPSTEIFLARCPNFSPVSAPLLACPILDFAAARRDLTYADLEGGTSAISVSSKRWPKP